MIIIHARIASAMKLLQRAVVMRFVSLVADQIAVRYRSLIAVHSTTELTPSSVQGANAF